MEIPARDLDDLRLAKQLLETTSFGMRLANFAGRPLERLTASLPEPASAALAGAIDRALVVALGVAVRSLDNPSPLVGERLHKAAVGVTGAIGGAFGFTTFALELPASTTLMLRSIAEIARREGELLDTREGQLACLQVFALGGRGSGDDAVENGYFAVRGAMAAAMREAAEYIAERGVTKGAPVLVRFLGMIAARLGVPLSEKFVAQALPLIGAAGGAAINLMFIDHFQHVARGHFVVRRLERQYGKERVRELYEHF